MIKTFEPAVFDKSKVISGVTQRNIDTYPPFGFSVYPADIYSKFTSDYHLSLLAEKLGVSLTALKCNKQTHGIDIIEMNMKTLPSVADGIIVTEPGVIAYVKIADCCGILLHSSEKNIVAAVHSGWRGTQQNISTLMIEKLKIEYGCQPKNILAYLSPCASGENYEVGPEVAELFPGYIVQKENGKYFFDNKKKICSQLTEAGVKPSNIEISGVCSIASEDCHSFRRDKTSSGRMAAFIGMK